MTNATIREQLCKQIDNLPDDVVEQVADFTLFLMTRRQMSPRYADWKSNEWQDFALGQLFRDEDKDRETLQSSNSTLAPAS